VLYEGRDAQTVSALGVEVSAGSDRCTVSAAGWVVDSDTGGAQLYFTPNSRHPQPRLPHVLAPEQSATWMMTEDEILAALADNQFDIAVEAASAVLTPFATLNGNRVEGEAMPLRARS